MTTIYVALAAVMNDLTSVAKRDLNQHQRFHFRGIDAVVNAVGPVLRKHKVIVVPDVTDVAYDQVQTSTGKPATACRVRVAYHFIASDETTITANVVAEAWDHGDKAAPKAMSVAFRTALLQALALPTDEPDPDSQSFEQAPSEAEKPATRRMGLAVNQSQLSKMHACFNDLGITDRDERLAYTNRVLFSDRDDDGRPVASSKELTKAQAIVLINALEADITAAVPSLAEPPEEAS